MERCPHCGAATRPGAKFCTSCGTRLEEPAEAPPAWSDTSATEETQVSASPVTTDDTTQESEPVTPEPDWAKVVPDVEDEDTGTVEPSATSIWSAPPETDHNETNTESADVPASDESDWARKWPESPSGTTTTDTSPADRLTDALNTADEPADTGEEDSTINEPSFPERHIWSWGARNDEPGSDESDASSDESGAESGWQTSSSDDDDTSGIVAVSETIAPQPDTAGFSKAGQVDHLSGDESLSTDETSANAGTVAAISTDESGDDARQRASMLLDELRGLIWEIGEDDSSTTGDQQTIISNMKRIRGATSDFSDLERVIAAVQEHPRDIDALRDLGQQADRLQELLDSHAALTTALEDAIRQGNR